MTRNRLPTIYTALWGFLAFEVHTIDVTRRSSYATSICLNHAK